MVFTAPNPKFVLFLIGSFASLLITLHAGQARNSDQRSYLRQAAQLRAINHNLQIIEAAKKQWIIAQQKRPTDAVQLSDLTGYFKDNLPPSAVGLETYQLTTAGAYAVAVLAGSSDLNGKTGPFTITSF